MNTYRHIMLYVYRAYIYVIFIYTCIYASDYVAINLYTYTLYHDIHTHTYIYIYIYDNNDILYYIDVSG